MSRGPLSTHPRTLLTPQEYLEIERKAEFRSEYHAGEMFAMAGAREAHNLINGNATGELRNQLRRTPCRVYSNEMRVQVPAADLYVYPDVVEAGGKWVVSPASRAEDFIEFSSIPCRLALRDVYEKVEFGTEPPGRHRRSP
jgi:Uma2 family endonuclease